MIDGLIIRLEPDAQGIRWYLRDDYSTSERSGISATIREALLAIAAIYGSTECERG